MFDLKIFVTYGIQHLLRSYIYNRWWSINTAILSQVLQIVINIHWGHLGKQLYLSSKRQLLYWKGQSRHILQTSNCIETICLKEVSDLHWQIVSCVSSSYNDKSYLNIYDICSVTMNRFRKTSNNDLSPGSSNILRPIQMIHSLQYMEFHR